MIGNLYAMFSEELSTFLFISQKQWRFQFQTYHNTRRHICHHVKHRKREPEGVHGQLEGCNRNLRSKAAVANNNHMAPKVSGGQEYYNSINILSKSKPNRSSSSKENTKKQNFSVGWQRSFGHHCTYSKVTTDGCQGSVNFALYNLSPPTLVRRLFIKSPSSPCTLISSS